MLSRSPLAWQLLLASTALLGACAGYPEPTHLPRGVRSPYTGYRSAAYEAQDAWVCRPDLATDSCREGLDATELHDDGSRTTVRHVPAKTTKVDCFYVYPTVDLGVVPANDERRSHVAQATQATAREAGRLSEVCNVFAPLYRQVSIGTYALASNESRARRLAIAYSDVRDAFAHYLGQYNRGRKVVLMGHSQGADMVVRLVRDFFEGDPLLRDRLLLAIPLGSPVEVPEGKLRGATFDRTPVCSRADQTGCVIAFQSRLVDDGVPPKGWLPGPGNETICVNPASEEAPAPTPLSRTYFDIIGTERPMLRGTEGISTRFVLVRNRYEAACVAGANGYRYLGISRRQAGGPLTDGPLDLHASGLHSSFGLHAFDAALVQGDLISAVARRVATLP